MANEPLQYGRIYHIYNRGNNGENLFVQQLKLFLLFAALCQAYSASC